LEILGSRGATVMDPRTLDSAESMWFEGIDKFVDGGGLFARLTATVRVESDDIYSFGVVSTGGLLRPGIEPLHAVVVARGAVLFAGGPPVAAVWRAGKHCGQVGHSQARSRLGSPVMRHLHDELVGPIAGVGSRGPGTGVGVSSLDCSTLDVTDELDNDAAFGRPGASHGETGFPQIRSVSLVENGAHVLFGSQM